VEILWKYWTAALVSGLLYWALSAFVPSAAAFYAKASPLARIGIGLVAYPLFYLAVIVVLFQGFKPITKLLSLTREMLSR
jgi:hypothetical protein